MSFIRANMQALGVSPEILEKNEIHVHVPAGGTPKDGPSAGITMATSVLSAILGVAPKAKTAMTGEISLHGKILAIGGLKEKLLAAQREGIEEVLLPESNKPAYMGLPANVKRKLTVRFVSQYWQVFQELFGRMPMPMAVPSPLLSPVEHSGRQPIDKLAV
jgi:ATP-dependent Lon protease